MDKNPLKVLFVTPEIVPFKATGGLADVGEALPQALKQEGVEAVRVMPKYKGIEESYELAKEFSFIVEAGGRANVVTLYSCVDNDVLTLFIGSGNHFERDGIYGYDDDGIRFGLFCKAVVEMLMYLDFKPDIVHLNDWQSALIGLSLKEEYSEIDFYKDIKVVYTIHNLQYQGVFDRSMLGELNFSDAHFNMEAIEYYGKVCFMKAGIVYADLVTTVSKTYSQEIQTQWYGYGLDGLLRKFSDKITGIVNGIYYDKYNPAMDKALLLNFDENNFRELRPRHKSMVQEAVGLPARDVPLFGVVTRLAEQKGIDLIIQAMEHFLNEDVQFLILGSGDHYFERRLQELEQQYPDKVKVIIQFNMNVARQIYGASDMFLMPSLFEPCGLSQLYSLRYGSVPIVRKTGGLVDTIRNLIEHPEDGTGFSFKNYNAQEFIEAIHHAINVYYDRERWQQLVERCMRQRFSWQDSAKLYIENYYKLMQ